MAETHTALVSDENVLFELWYRFATTLGYKPEDFRFVKNLMVKGQEAWGMHCYYAEINGLPVLSEQEYLFLWLKEHVSRADELNDNAPTLGVVE
jgi:hypothetical protein